MLVCFDLALSLLVYSFRYPTWNVYPGPLLSAPPKLQYLFPSSLRWLNAQFSLSATAFYHCCYLSLYVSISICCSRCWLVYCQVELANAWGNKLSPVSGSSPSLCSLQILTHMHVHCFGCFLILSNRVSKKYFIQSFYLFSVG